MQREKENEIDTRCTKTLQEWTTGGTTLQDKYSIALARVPST